MISARALHFVFKIGDRAKNIHFFREVLGMQVLRHEEFTEGCEAACNGPYDNRWSKTMVGYGPESSHFVVELTYNYGMKHYPLGTDFVGLTIKSTDIVDRAVKHGYPVKKVADETHQAVIVSPEGYPIFIVSESPAPGTDPVQRVALHVTDLERSRRYWVETLGMAQLEGTGSADKKKKKLDLSYDKGKFTLELVQLEQGTEFNRAKAYGRIAFAVPYDDQPKIEQLVRAANGTILTPLITLDTPGKATVRVIILGDPDGHEICFVDEEGFSALSAVDPASNDELAKYIAKDPFQDK